MASTGRRIARTVTGLALVAASVPFAGGTASAATTDLVGLQGGWWWATQISGAAVNGVGAPAGTPAAASGVTVGDGDLAVAYKGDPNSAPDKVSALALDLIDVPAGATIDTMVFTIKLDPDQKQAAPQAEGAPLVACFATSGWAEAEGENLERNAPQYDCAEPVVPVYDAAAKSYTFDVTAFAAEWASTGFNNGVVLAPAVGATPFQVVFDKASSATGSISFTEASASPSEPAPSTGDPGTGTDAGTPASGGGESTTDSGSTGGSGGSDFPSLGTDFSASGGSTDFGGSGSTALPPLVSPGGSLPASGSIAGPQVAEPVTAAPATRAVSALDLRPDLTPPAAFFLALLGLGGALAATSLYLGSGAAAAAAPAAPAAPLGTGSPLDRALRARTRTV